MDLDNAPFGVASGFVTSRSGSFYGQRVARLADEKNTGGLPAGSGLCDDPCRHP